MPLVLFAGAVATIFTCFLITPFEAVRIRMVERPGRVRVRVGVRVGVGAGAGCWEAARGVPPSRARTWEMSGRYRGDIVEI